MKTSRLYAQLELADVVTLIGELEDVYDQYTEQRGVAPDLLFLHPSWKTPANTIALLDLPDWVEDWEFDARIPQPDVFYISDSASENHHLEVSQILMNGQKEIGRDSWRAFQIADTEYETMKQAISSVAGTFAEKTGVVPDSVSLDEVWQDFSERIHEDTGLELVFDPPVPYETWGYVGVREVFNNTVRVESSNVESITFVPNPISDPDEPANGTLYVKFIRAEDKPQALYTYFKVPMLTYEEMLRAKSKGGFVNLHLKDKYDHQKLDIYPAE